MKWDVIVNLGHAVCMGCKTYYAYEIRIIIEDIVFIEELSYGSKGY